MTLDECRNMASKSIWASFSIWVVGNGIKCACETLGDANDAFDGITKQFPSKTILLFDLNANTCIREGKVGRYEIRYPRGIVCI